MPKDEYFPLTRTDKTLPKQLLRNFENIPSDATGDLFGQIYEYFIAEFARSEGQKGGEWKVFDPACGSGGMFVQSAKFIEEHR